MARRDDDGVAVLLLVHQVMLMMLLLNNGEMCDDGSGRGKMTVKTNGDDNLM